jgi:hypothetical protein
MIYEVIGRLTVKAARYWISRKAPASRAILAAAGVAGVLAVATAVLVAGSDEPDDEV